jgi:hypothetical protein
MVQSAARDHLGVKKVKAPSKNLEELPIIVFFPRTKNNITNDWNQRSIGIFMYRCGHTPQNRQLSLEKHLKIADYVFSLLTKNAPKIKKKIHENIKVRLFLNRSIYHQIIQA